MSRNFCLVAPTKITSKLLVLGLAWAAFFILSENAQATRFTGAVNTLWSVDENWEGLVGPGNSAEIPAGKLVDLDVAVGISSVTMEPGSNIRNAGGSLSISGSFNFQGGGIGVDCQDPELPVTIGPDATLSFTGGALKGISGCVTIHNFGTIQWSGGPVFFDGKLNNAGNFIIQGNAGFGSAVRTGLINNTGIIQKVSGDGVTQFAGFTPETNSIATAINNMSGGLVSVASGTVEMGPGSSVGEFRISAGKKLLVSQDHTFDEATFTGTGICSMTARMTFVGQINSTADIELVGENNQIFGGTSAQPAAFLDGTGRFLWKSGRLTGTLTLGAGLHSILSEGAVKSYDGTITNRGTMDWVGPGPLATNLSTFRNEGTFNVLGNGVFLADTGINGQTFENIGTLNTFAGGESRTDDTVIVNSGTLNIGGIGSAGILRTIFRQTASGTLHMEVGGGNGSVPEFDQIIGGVSNPSPTQVAGALVVELINNFIPAQDQRFVLINQNGGQFSSISVPGGPDRLRVENPPVFGNFSTELVSLTSGPIPFNLWAAGRDLTRNERADLAGEAQPVNATVPEWSYGFRNTPGGSALTLFTAAQHQNGLGQADIDGWSAGVGVSVSVNTGSGPVSLPGSEPLQPGQLLVVPTPQEFAVARWTAPETGTFAVAARWVDADERGGNGAAGYVVLNGQQIFGGQDSASRLFTGARWVNGGRVSMPPRSLRLSAGDTLDFVVGSNGESGNDLTALNAIVRRVPTFTISAPATSVAGQDVTVTVDGPATLTGVALRRDGMNVGTDLEAPFQFVLKGLTPGVYDLQAEGLASGLLVPSNTLTLTVNDAPASALARRGGATDAAAATGSTYDAIVSGTWDRADIWRRRSDGGSGVPGPNDIIIVPSSVQVVLDQNRTARKIFSEGKLAGPDGTNNLELTATEQLSVAGLTRDLTIKIPVGAVLTNVKGSAFFENVKVENRGEMVISKSLFAAGGSVDNHGAVTLRPPPGQGGPVILAAPTLMLAGTVRLAPGVAIAGNLIGLDGSTLIGLDGSTLIGNDGSTLVGNDGASLIGNDGSTLIGNDGSTLIGNDGSTLIGNDGSTLIGNDGSTLVGNDGASLAQINAAALIGNDGSTRPVSQTEHAVGAPSGSASISVTNSAVSGNCNLIGNVALNNSYLLPGSSAGTIVVAGDLNLSANSTTVLEVGGGSTQPTASDRLTVLGTANLGGNLIVRAINNFTPAANDPIPLLTYGAASGNFGSITSNAQIALGADGATVQVNGANPPAPKALNISTRMRVEAGDNVLIAGFIVTGSQPKRVIIRGLGPSLPVAGALADPILELDGGAVINDDWRSTQEGEIIATTIPPSNNQEAAIVATLAPGGHTAILRGKNNGTGVGLVEVYDLEPNAPAQLANISTRGLVQTGDNVMIGGFIVGGTYPAKVIVRAIGPSLSQQGVSGALQDPTLELVDSQGNIISNDNWRSSQEAEVIASTVAPTNDNEAAIVATLIPGNYTAIVRGKNGTTGIALVEGYNLQ